MGKRTPTGEKPSCVNSQPFTYLRLQVHPPVSHTQHRPHKQQPQEFQSQHFELFVNGQQSHASGSMSLVLRTSCLQARGAQEPLRSASV